MEAADQPSSALGTSDLPLDSIENPQASTPDYLQAREMDHEEASDAGTHDSLTDSTYEIISATNTRSSDEEDSSHDDNDSLISLEDEASEYTNARREDYVSPEASRAITPAPDTTDDEDDTPHPDQRQRTTSNIDYSELTDGTVLQTPRASISFDPSALEKGNSVTEVSHLVDESTKFLQNGITVASSRCTVEQTLAPSKMEMKRSFRIYWHGEVADQETVIAKIAQALAVSSDTSMDSSIMKESSSKFSIVQLGSFGHKPSSPQVTLIPTAKTEVIVDTCPTCSANSTRGTDSSARRRHDHSLSNNADLEVFYYSKGPSWSNQFDDIRSSTINPYLDIRPTTPSFPLQPFQPLRGKAVHVRVDGELEKPWRKDAFLWRPTTVPIDVKHFQQLDPELLNRNLRCLQDTVAKTSKIRKYSTVINTAVTDFKRKLLSTPTRTCITRTIAVGLLYTILIHIAMKMASILGSAPTLSNDGGGIAPEMSTVTVTSTLQSTETTTYTVPGAAIGPSHTSTAHMTPIAISSNDVGRPLGEAHPPSFSQFELLRSEEGNMYLKLPHEMAKLRRPPPINVTTFIGRPLQVVDSTLTRWNASVYSLEVKNYDPKSDPLGIEIDSVKSSGVYQTLYYAPQNSRYSIRVLESGLMACLETAQKELSLFRDQASGLVLSSSEWLQAYMNRTSKTRLADDDLWERLAARRDMIQRRADIAMQNVNQRADVLTSALTQRATELMESRKDVQKYVEGINSAVTKKVAEAEKVWLRTSGWKTANPLVEARNRVNFLANKAHERLAERIEARRSRKLKRLEAIESRMAEREARASTKFQRHRAKCAKGH